MKTLSAIILAFVASVSALAQGITVVGNSDVNTDFSKYRTFTWATSDPTIVGPGGYDIYYYDFATGRAKGKHTSHKNDKKSNYIYSYSVIIPAKEAGANGTIQDAISNELEGRGYRENSELADTTQSGDLVVAYRVLDQKANLRGYIDENPKGALQQQVLQSSDTTTYALEPGTLMITLIDEKTSTVVWDGFVSGLLDQNAFVTDEEQLKESVRMIFDNFKYTADKASKN